MAAEIVPVVRSDLRTRALDLADMTGTDFPVTARLDDSLNAGMAMLHNILSNVGEGDYIADTMNISVVANTETYILEEDTDVDTQPNQYIGKILDVYEQYDADTLIPVPLFNRDDRPVYSRPKDAATLVVRHIPVYFPMTADSEEVPRWCQPGWEWYAIYHCAIHLLGREESDVRLWQALQAKLEQVIIKTASPRVIGETDQVQDVDRRFEYDWYVAGRQTSKYRYRVEGHNLRVLQVQSELLLP